MTLEAMTKVGAAPIESVTLTELPERPTGWTKHLSVHFNYGRAGGAATYEIRDEKGRRTNIGYAYDTRKSKEAPRGESGFFVNGSGLMSWADLRARYTELTAPKDALPKRGNDGQQ